MLKKTARRVKCDKETLLVETRPKKEKVKCYNLKDFHNERLKLTE